MDWILTDSSLPVGSYIHSNGIEAASKRLCVDEPYLKALLKSLATSCLPYLRMIRRDIPLNRLLELDGQYDALLTNHVSKRASITQGLAYLSLLTRSFGPIETPNAFRRAVLSKASPGHLPLCFALTCHAFDIPMDRTPRLFLIVQAKGIVSACVRLNIFGPFAGTTLLISLNGYIDTLLNESLDIPKENNENNEHLSILERKWKDEEVIGIMTSPVTDIIQGTHDRLYSRIFNS